MVHRTDGKRSHLNPHGKRGNGRIGKHEVVASHQIGQAVFGSIDNGNSTSTAFREINDFSVLVYGIRGEWSGSVVTLRDFYSSANSAVNSSRWDRRQGSASHSYARD